VRAIDVSMPMFDGMPAFPGDPAFVAAPVSRVGRGDPYDLSQFSFGSHAGTHLDPPSHFVPGGLSVDRLDLGVLNGPCRVVDARADGRTITAGTLGKVPHGASRILLRTSNSARWARRLEFFEDFVGLGLDAAVRLATRGVRLVGIDALSIETDLTGRFPVHHELLGRGVVILEGLLLDGVAPGPYELSCLPLPVKGGDGAPARAVLWGPDRGAAPSKGRVELRPRP